MSQSEISVSPTPRARGTHHDHNFEEGEACLGLDFGHSCSKMSLAYYMKGGSLPHLCRVPVPADESNAHDIDRASYSHQVIASAGWHEGAWVTGWQARECDESIPLKSMLTYLSGIPRKRVVEQLPGGKTLLRISQTEGRLDRATMRKLLSEHFAQLHTIATNLADDLGITIKVVAVTFPNYLCSEETDDFIDRYMGTLLDILVPIWGRRFLYQEISEGQATALYVVEQCDDVYSANPRKKRLGELFRGLDTSQQVNLIVADNGGSTTNFQSLSVSVDETGEIIHSQSNVPSNISTGSRGGSNTINDLVDLQIRNKLQQHIRHQDLPLGELAAMSREFDRRKKGLNYVTGVQPITFTCNLGNGTTERIVIGGDAIDGALKAAFNPGLRLIKKELRRAIDLGKDFAVIFCGGSYVNPGLWEETKSMMGAIRKEAAERGVSIQWLFLRTDQFWPCAVSSGAALSMMHLPSPKDLLRGSAIGLQEMKRDKDNVWVGANEAHVLYFDHNRPSAVLDIDNKDAARRSKLRFSLVCDPLYHESIASCNGGDELPPIKIGSEKGVHGRFTAYDLSMVLKPMDLPKGTVRVRLSLLDDIGKIDGGEDGDVWKLKSIPFLLTTQQVDVSGQRVFDSQDGKFLLKLLVDPPSKLLRVQHEVQRLPVWCSECAHEVLSARVCTECVDYTLCADCFFRFCSNPQLHEHQSFSRVDAPTHSEV